MNAFKEFIGLFVEDGTLAIAILVWVGLVKVLLVLDVLNPGACSFLLFSGLIVLFIENVVRSARKL